MLINAFASMRRMEIALECGLDHRRHRASASPDLSRTANARKDLSTSQKLLPKLGEAALFFLEVVSERRVQRNHPPQGRLFPRLSFPILHCWPAMPAASSRCRWASRTTRLTGKRNCGMYRMQVYDDGQTTGMHWQTHKQGADHYRRLAAEGKQTAYARCGGDRRRSSYDLFGDSASASGSMDEMLFAGFPRGKAGRNGEMRNLRSRGCRRMRRSCSRVT